MGVEGEPSTEEQQCKRKSKCGKAICVAWRLPLWSLALLVATFCIYPKLGHRMRDIMHGYKPYAVHPNVPGSAHKHHKGKKCWLIFGIFFVNFMVVFLSFMSSGVFYKTVGKKIVDKCRCCTRRVCKAFHWIFLILAYGLAIGSTATLVGVAGVLLCSVFADSLCKNGGGDQSVILTNVNIVLESVHNWICYHATHSKHGHGKKGCGRKMCDRFPSSLTQEQIGGFCHAADSALDHAPKLLWALAMAVVIQWTLAIIQRANIVGTKAGRPGRCCKKKEQGHNFISMQETVAVDTRGQVQDQGVTV